MQSQPGARRMSPLTRLERWVTAILVQFGILGFWDFGLSCRMNLPIVCLNSFKYCVRHLWKHGRKFIIHSGIGLCRRLSH